MYKCEELNKLEKWLKENKIEYHDNSDQHIERIAITHFSQHKDKYWLSVVCSKLGFGTYGCEKGLLEFWNMTEEVIGHLTAKNVIEIIGGRYMKEKTMNNAIIKKLKREHGSLANKYNKLCNFLNTKQCINKCSVTQTELLRRQSASMRLYLSCLEDRIKNLQEEN